MQNSVSSPDIPFPDPSPYVQILHILSQSDQMLPVISSQKPSPMTSEGGNLFFFYRILYFSVLMTYLHAFQKSQQDLSLIFSLSWGYLLCQEVSSLGLSNLIWEVLPGSLVRECGSETKNGGRAAQMCSEQLNATGDRGSVPLGTWKRL